MRRQPVAFALIDAAFLADSKFRALRRRLPDPQQYNSAVGAWLIVLTSARRNGLPEVDAAEEAEDPTFLPDLIAVGLLVETGIPEKPFRAWAPARPRYPSDSATNVPEVTDAPASPFPTPDSVSTHIPSSPFTSHPLKKKNGPRASFKDPLLVKIREAITEKYGPDDTPVFAPPVALPSAEDQEREAHRQEAYDLHERFLRQEFGPAEYEQRLRDIGKEPDDLTRADSVGLGA